MPVRLRQAAFTGHAPSQAQFYGGPSGLSDLSPHQFHVSLAGRPYLIDFSQPFYRQYRRQIAQLQRTQADTSTDPGEQTLDPNSMWRRSFEDWMLGAGQRWRDRKDSLTNRYWTSKGVDALTTRWQVSLLPDTVLARASASSNPQLLYANGWLYLTDGQQVYYTSDLAAWTAVAGLAGLATTCSSVCTDGYNIWMAYGSHGVYHTTAGSAAAADQWVTTAVDPAALVGYANGRLMLASTNVIYNIVAGTGSALPAPLWTAGNPATRFVAFAEGTGAVYAAGGVSTHHYIWGMTVTSDGTALGAPVVQGQVPDGEIIASLYGYLGFLIVGTSLGVRMCTTAANAAVSLGSLIPTPHPVGCLAGYNRFVYFGWTGYDTFSTGLGRMDLENHVIPEVLPAYASDLMAPGSAAVSAVAMFAGVPVFAVAAAGVYKTSANLVASGDIRSGLISYDLTDPKTFAQIDVAGPISAGSYTVSLSVNGGPFAPVGSHRATDPEPVTFSAGPVTGQTAEVDTVLYRDATNPAAGPVLSRWTLRAYPAPHRPLTWQVPLLLNEAVTDQNDQRAAFDPLYELQILEGLAAAGDMVIFQEGELSYPVFIMDVAFLPTYPTRDRMFFNGLALVTLQGLPPTGG